MLPSVHRHVTATLTNPSVAPDYSITHTHTHMKPISRFWSLLFSAFFLIICISLIGLVGLSPRDECNSADCVGWLFVFINALHLYVAAA